MHAVKGAVSLRNSAILKITYQSQFKFIKTNILVEK